jgi:rubrerythrin
MELKQLFAGLVANKGLHAKFLNTLSLMENTGARKISACEHKTEVTMIVLKHAAEEHRHAYYLKKQIGKLDEKACPTYADEYLAAPYDSRLYLNKLDVMVCRYLKNTLGLSGAELRFAAYLLVTYAIEVRADELYPVYQEVLDETKSKVNVKSIILEEEGHLEEMLHQLKQFSPDWEVHAQKAVDIETGLFNDWIVALSGEVKN